MRLLPTSNYSGLTLILQNPSRMDLRVSPIKLLSGAAGVFIENECLNPLGWNLSNLDVGTLDTHKETRNYLPGTKCVMLLGKRALHTVLPEYKGYFLGEQRGIPLLKDSIVHIPSIFPQDCMDMFDYESQFNSQENSNTEQEADEDEEDGDEKQRHGKTKRSNYRFWIKQDFRRAKEIIQNNGQVPTSFKQPEYYLYPSVEECCRALREHVGEYMELDIETDNALHVTVFSFSFGDSALVVTVPVIRYDYSLAYSVLGLCQIFRSLAYAMSRNITVTHNGFGFDLFVLAYNYRLPIGENHYDTLLAEHRIYPEAEKSLGHCMSIHTWEQFHKDEGIFNPHNVAQERKLWEYNAKDVWGMKLVRMSQQKLCAGDSGLKDSVDQANEMVRPYLINTLMGIAYDEQENLAIRQKNDRLMMQHLRMLKILVGNENYPRPNSNKSCVDYFHEQLGYKAVGKSKKTGKPSLDEKNMLKLKLKYPENAAIDVCLAYRQKAKESGMLKFTPWEGIRK